MPAALIVIDMLNPYDHEDAEPLMESAREVVDPLAELVRAARQRGDLIVYVNDCYEDWSAGRDDITRLALEGRAPELVEPLVPEDGMPFVIKSRHSIFYGTQLEYLLRQEECEHLVLTGQVTEQCVLYSALDAYVRRFEITVARDCVAHIDEELARAAVRMMESNMRARILPGEQALEAAAKSDAEDPQDPSEQETGQSGEEAEVGPEG